MRQPRRARSSAPRSGRRGSVPEFRARSSGRGRLAERLQNPAIWRSAFPASPERSGPEDSRRRVGTGDRKEVRRPPTSCCRPDRVWSRTTEGPAAARSALQPHLRPPSRSRPPWHHHTWTMAGRSHRGTREEHLRRMLALPAPRRPVARPRTWPLLAGSSLSPAPYISPQRLDLRGRQHAATRGHAVVLAVLNGVDEALLVVGWELAQIGPHISGIDHAKPMAMRAVLRLKGLAALHLRGLGAGGPGRSGHVIACRGPCGYQRQCKRGHSDEAAPRHFL